MVYFSCLPIYPDKMTSWSSHNTSDTAQKQFQHIKNPSFQKLGKREFYITVLSRTYLVFFITGLSHFFYFFPFKFLSYIFIQRAASGAGAVVLPFFIHSERIPRGGAINVFFVYIVHTHRYSQHRTHCD